MNWGRETKQPLPQEEPERGGPPLVMVVAVESNSRRWDPLEVLPRGSLNRVTGIYSDNLNCHLNRRLNNSGLFFHIGFEEVRKSKGSSPSFYIMPFLSRTFLKHWQEEFGWK